MVSVRELGSIGEVEALRDTWNNVLRASRDNEVFSTWEWVTCWWKHFGEHRRLRVLVAEEGSRVIAIAPLMLSGYPFIRFGTLRKIEFIGSPQSDINNFLWSEREQECLSLFLEHLAKQNDWDCLELRDVHQRSLLAKLLPGQSIPYHWAKEESVSGISPYIELPHTFQELTNQLGSVMRHNANRRLRRLREKYSIDMKTYHDFASVEKAMDTMFGLHQERRASISDEPSGFATSQARAFHNDLAKQFASKGWLALNFLTADGEPIATTYSFEYRQKTYVYQVGFDPRFSRYGVGTLLHLRNIEDNIGRQLKEYDFLKGAEAYKFNWPVRVRRVLRIGLAKRGFMFKALWLAEKKRRQLGKFLRRTGARQTQEE